jgi:hypothetical protein
MPRISDRLRKLLFGTPWGETFPPSPPPRTLAKDGRTVALEILREYVCNLDFFRPMALNQPPQKFNIDPENFHLEWPDNVVDFVSPSVVIIPGQPATYEVIGLTTYVEEETRDVYGPGTVLQWQSEHTELFELEVWTDSIVLRRSVIAGLENALTPTEQMFGLRFRMPDYFNELVCFTLFHKNLVDGPMSANRRRKVQFGIHMRFNIVALVNYRTLKPTVTVNTDVDQSTGLPIDLTDDGTGNTQVLPP